MKALPIFVLALGWLPFDAAHAQGVFDVFYPGTWAIAPNQSINIEWTSPVPTPPDVSLSLIDATLYCEEYDWYWVSVAAIGNNIPNIEMHSWIFPEEINGTSTCGGVYHIYIEDASAPASNDYSEKFPIYEDFTPTSPSINDIFASGAPVTIGWTGGCLDWPIGIGLIDYSTGGSGTVVETVVTDALNDGSFDWIFPADLPCGEYGFYIQDGTTSPSCNWPVPMNWKYGPIFSIACPCFPPPDGMVAWWPMDELGGDTILGDVAPSPTSVVANDATPMPGGMISSSIPGQVGGALLFGGLYGESPSEAEFYFGEQDFSMDAWVRLVECDSGVISPIVDKYDQQVVDEGYSFYIQDNLLKLNMTGTTFSSTDVLTSFTEWYHVAVSVDRDPGLGVFYIDGLPAGTFVPLTASVGNDLSLLIGKTRQSSGSCEIAIDELELFNVPLTGQAVLGVYEAGDAGKCKTGSICVQKFEDTDGDGIWDSDELPLANLDFEVVDANGDLVGTISSVADGEACLWFNAPADYLVTEVPQADWTATTPSQIAVELESGEEEDLLFGNILEDEPFCDLQITKRFCPDTADVGQFVTVILDVTNVGTGACWDELGTTVTDHAPNGLVFDTPLSSVENNGVGNWSASVTPTDFTAVSFQSLPTGYHVQFTFNAKGTVVTTAQNCAEVTNSAEVVDSSNNHDCDTIDITPPCGCQSGGTGRLPWSSGWLWMVALLAPLARRRGANSV